MGDSEGPGPEQLFLWKKKKKVSHSPECDRVLTSFSEPLYGTGNCKVLSVTNLPEGVNQGQPSGPKGFSAGICSTKTQSLLLYYSTKTQSFLV